MWRPSGTWCFSSQANSSSVIERRDRLWDYCSLKGVFSGCLYMSLLSERCLMPKKVGPCRATFPRWHFNPATKKCENFIFGGCKENLNNFLSLEECAKACQTVSGTLLFLLHPVMIISLKKYRYIGSHLLTLDNSSPHYSMSQCGSVCVSWIIRLRSRALGSLMCVLCQTQVQCCSAAAQICCSRETKDE